MRRMVACQMVTTLVLQLPRTAPLRTLALPDCRSLEVATVVGAQLQSLNLTSCSELHSLSLQCDSLDELSLSLVRVAVFTAPWSSTPSLPAPLDHQPGRTETQREA